MYPRRQCPNHNMVILLPFSENLHFSFTKFHFIVIWIACDDSAVALSRFEELYEAEPFPAHMVSGFVAVTVNRTQEYTLFFTRLQAAYPQMFVQRPKRRRPFDSFCVRAHQSFTSFLTAFRTDSRRLMTGCRTSLMRCT